ncbi:MAG: hypothetical protein CMI16_02630 [Opitutaceae bacterium]|nr:hypothetical protein [Opitutaceae bacterium]
MIDANAASANAASATPRVVEATIPPLFEFDPRATRGRTTSVESYECRVVSRGVAWYRVVSRGYIL